ncbi:MAG TPA: histidine phosphatase family protein [Pyrinomonadaceae bacterium]|nr:histidine phosphatase family protein [Pyrinomonadaceae bacterium]
MRRATKIMLIRHAEKPAQSPPPYGVTDEGERESESLTVRGWQRAGALAHLFAPHGGSPPHPALAAPTLIYASKPKRRAGSRRSLETVTPLAEKLAIKVNTNFTRDEAAEMVEEAFLCEAVVLVCWQQEFIPWIANHILGDTTTAPQDWPEDRFDVIWVFDLDPAAGRYAFAQVPQNLLMGDWAIPIRR